MGWSALVQSGLLSGDERGVVVCVMTKADVRRLLLGDPRIAARISETLLRRHNQRRHGVRVDHHARPARTASPARRNHQVYPS